MAAGALGCSISGAGPTVFAWALDEHAAAVLASHATRVRARINRHSMSGSLTSSRVAHRSDRPVQLASDGDAIYEHARSGAARRL